MLFNSNQVLAYLLCFSEYNLLFNSNEVLTYCYVSVNITCNLIVMRYWHIFDVSVNV